MIYTLNDNQIPQIGNNCFIAPSADVIGSVSLGDEASVWYHATIRGDVNSITIGERTNIQDNAVLHVTHDLPLTIGKRCTVGHSAILHACTIGDDCLIGMGSTVLDGAVIGEESMVAAGALVTPNKHFPKRSMLMGSPAKLVRIISDEEFASMQKNAQEYWEFGSDLANGRQTATHS